MKQFRTTPTFNDKPARVDREKRIIYGVQVVEEGVNKNDTHFSQKFLTDLVQFGNDQGEAGIRSNFGHPTMCSSSLGMYLGRKRNFVLEGSTVYADLHLDPITEKTEVEGKGITLFEWVCDMAENNPDMFGCSIHLSSGKFEEEAFEQDGQKFDSHIFTGLLASDIVDYPAATSGGLFSESDDLGVIVTNFLNDNQNVFEKLAAEPELFPYMMSTYTDYLKIHNKDKFMTLSKEVQKILNPEAKFDINATLGNGDIVTVVTENEEAEEGDEVNDAEGKALTDGEHVLPDGSKWVITKGKISEIIPADEEEEEENEEAPTEMEAVLHSIKDLNQTFKTDLSKSNTETFEAVKSIAKTVAELTGKFNTLAAGVHGVSIEYFQSEKFEENKNLSIADKARAKRESQEN